MPYATPARHTGDPFGDLIARRHDGLLRALGEDAGAPRTGARLVVHVPSRRAL